MVGQTSAVTNVTADKTIVPQGRHAILKGIYVTKIGTAGDKIDFKSGGAGGTIVLTVFTDGYIDMPIINTPFADGLYADVTFAGTPNVVVLYE